MKILNKMTYEEAILMQREMLKDSIKARLYKINPEKYKKFKDKSSKKGINTIDIVKIWNMVKTIHTYKHGDPFEMDDKFFAAIKRKSK